jgi:hypothetical protein
MGLIDKFGRSKPGTSISDPYKDSEFEDSLIEDFADFMKHVEENTTVAKPTLYHPQVRTPWIPPINSTYRIVEEDLTTTEKDDNIQDMTNTATNNLLPQGELLLQQGMNVMLIGPHGTGKTQSVMDLCTELGLKMKYYSCSTLDPYTDLVGVPVPKKDEDGKDYLQMVRPREVDEAEFIFFDEFNRADAKTLNAIFEIIQFKSINGEKLPNLKACWAAMNPPDEDYQVEEIDPALLDRFDIFIEVMPKPSVAYMSQFVPEQVAKALHVWWNEHERSRNTSNTKKKRDRIDYISPRRLLKIGLIWEATGQNSGSVKRALPPGGTFESGKLIELLRSASSGGKIASGGIGNAAHPDFEYNAKGIHESRTEIIKWLTDNPTALETHRAVLEGLRRGVGGVALTQEYGSVLNAISPSLLEAFIAEHPAAKQSHMRTGFASAYKLNRNEVKKWDNLYKILKVKDQGILPKF